MRTFLFYIGFATLVAHEMDAIMHKEWRLLYFFRKLPEDIASTLFIGAHVPLLALLMWLAHHGSSTVQQGTRSAIALFLVIHTVIHRRLEQHPVYTFHSWLSKSLIYGSGLLGCLYLLLTVWSGSQIT
ncbi:MAG: DUF6713 family protein [Cyanobacteria bacterium J06621_3]